MLFPNRAGWDLQTILLGKAVDYLALLVWTKSKGARRGWGRPKTVLPFGQAPARPGSKPKPAPLSVVKERMRRLHRGMLRRPAPINKGEAIREMFKPTKDDK